MPDTGMHSAPDSPPPIPHSVPRRQAPPGKFRRRLQRWARKAREHLWLSLILPAVALLMVLLIGLPGLFALGMTRRPRDLCREDGMAEVGLSRFALDSHESEAYAFYGGGGGRTMVLLAPGVNDLCEEWVERASFVRSRGCAVAMVNYGEARKGKTSLGTVEAKDLAAAIEEFGALMAGRRFVIWGRDVGAAAALRAAAGDERVVAVIAEGCYDTLEGLVDARIHRLLPLSGTPLPRIATWFTRRRAGGSEHRDPIEIVAGLERIRLLYVVCDGCDIYAPPAMSERMFEATPGEKEMVRGGSETDGDVCRERVSALLEAAREDGRTGGK